MTLNLKNITTTLFILLALGLSTWSIFLSSQSRMKYQNAIDQPDAFMENVTATMMNKQGKPALKIETAKMIHYPNDSARVEAPHITIYRDSPQPWSIDAAYAILTEGLAEITFHHNVIIHHPHDPKHPQTIMRTDSLKVLPEKKIAHTDDSITLLQPNLTVYAIGMLANLNDSTVKLLSQARQEYAIQP